MTMSVSLLPIRLVHVIHDQFSGCLPEGSYCFRIPIRFACEQKYTITAQQEPLRIQFHRLLFGSSVLIQYFCCTCCDIIYVRLERSGIQKRTFAASAQSKKLLRHMIKICSRQQHYCRQYKADDPVFPLMHHNSFFSIIDRRNYSTLFLSGKEDKYCRL